MKKFYFIAAAAIAVMASCSKVEFTSTPDKTIGYQVASYANQTKAGETSFLSELEELGITSSQAFKSKAFIHAAQANGTVAAPVAFYSPAIETISWDSTNHEWAPSHVYYWPKGAQSFVNFIGWYGKDGSGNPSDPTITYEYDGTASKYKATLVWNYTSVAGNSASNLLYADMAWRFKANNDSATYGVSGASEGVPMLFHHALAQINVKVYADGTNLTAGSGSVSDANATWTIALENPKITPVYNTGTLTLTNVDPGTTATAQAWTGSWAGSGSTGDITASNLNVDKVSKATANTLFNATCVVPQTIGATVKLTFDMRITTTYKTNPTNPNVELIPAEVTLNAMGTTAWAQNTRYTYYIKIVPSQNEVLFDPALEANWTDVEGTEQTL